MVPSRRRGLLQSPGGEGGKKLARRATNTGKSFVGAIRWREAACAYSDASRSLIILFAARFASFSALFATFRFARLRAMRSRVLALRQSMSDDTRGETKGGEEHVVTVISANNITKSPVTIGAELRSYL
jgi:hypothetical protein